MMQPSNLSVRFKLPHILYLKKKQTTKPTKTTENQRMFQKIWKNLQIFGFQGAKLYLARIQSQLFNSLIWLAVAHQHYSTLKLAASPSISFRRKKRNVVIQYSFTESRRMWKKTIWSERINESFIIQHRYPQASSRAINY